MPENDRIFFFQILNLLTEINIQVKLSSFFIKDAENEIINKSINSYKIFLTTIKAGKLFEGWRVLQKDFFKKALSKELEPHISEKGKKNLNILKRYFSNDNHLIEIRNTMAFHSDSDEIKKQFDEYGPDEPFELYWSSYTSNCFSTTYYTVLDRLLNKIDPEQENASNKLFKDINEITIALRSFISELILYYVDKYFEDPIECEIPNKENVYNSSSPFFYDG